MSCPPRTKITHNHNSPFKLRIRNWNKHQGFGKTSWWIFVGQFGLDRNVFCLQIQHSHNTCRYCTSANVQTVHLHQVMWYFSDLHTHSFRTCCSYPSHSKWLSPLWSGTTCCALYRPEAAVLTLHRSWRRGGVNSSVNSSEDWRKERRCYFWRNWHVVFSMLFLPAHSLGTHSFQRTLRYHRFWNKVKQ